MSLDVAAVRAEFPLLARDPSLVYLDHASTTPRPRRVLEAIRRYHEEFTANVHRGVHPLAAEASAAYEAARHAVAAHVGASAGEVVFVRGTTEAINLVAHGLELGPDDEVVVTGAEHHANLLPWRARARVVVLPSRADGAPDWTALDAALGARTRLVAVHHASNVLGGVAPLEAVAAAARRRGVPVLVDGAQAAGHLPVDLAALDVDFYALSGHKLGGPSGCGALVARRGWVERLAPREWGGGMVARVDETAVELRPGPHRHEAGTPCVEGALGLGAALGLLRELGMDQVEAHGRRLARALVEGAATLPGVRLLGPADGPRVPLVALALPEGGLDAETVARTVADVGRVLCSAGRHCAHPLHDRLGVGATLRLSAWVTNDEADVARAFEALRGLIG